jgi:multiple sugar transport system permease protein/raffinose/stachyose/melibiose transport system permease protein
MSKGRILKGFIIHVVLFLAILTVLFPFFWMVTGSVKTSKEIFSIPPIWLPWPPDMDPYKRVLQSLNFLLYFWNTLRVSVITTGVSLFLGTLAAYGLSRFRFRGKNQVLSAILATQMFPLVLLIIPYYILLSRAHLMNTDLSLVMAYTSFTLPFCVWFLIGIFEAVPRELDEAAQIDGCSYIGILFRIVIPTALPGIGATAAFAFLNAWNQYLLPLVVTTDTRKHTLPLAVASLMGQTRFQWNDVMAAAVLASMPPLLLFIALQKYFISGLAEGTLK